LTRGEKSSRRGKSQEKIDHEEWGDRSQICQIVSKTPQEKNRGEESTKEIRGGKPKEKYRKKFEQHKPK